MAREGRAQIQVTIRKTVNGVVVIDYVGRPATFNFDVDGVMGPVVGSITVPVGGVAVDLSALTTPGVCEFYNQDSTNYVTYGIRDPGTNVFYPFGELLPGERWANRLSRALLEEYTGTGTGTTAPGNQLWLKANTAACVVNVAVFEK